MLVMRALLLVVLALLPPLAAAQSEAILEIVRQQEAEKKRAAEALEKWQNRSTDHYITPQEGIALKGRPGAIRMLEQQKGIPASRSIVPQQVTVRHEFPIGQKPKVIYVERR